MRILRSRQELRDFRASLDYSPRKNDASDKDSKRESRETSRGVAPGVAPLESPARPLSIGLVPTMGALHAGHAALIQASRKRDSHTIVTIFVNPAQFAPNEDLSTYPRTPEEDYALCENLGVSAVFAPSVEEMYPPPASPAQEGSLLSLDEVSILPPRSMGYVLEGFARPTHFAGVLQIVLKLFLLSSAHNAYFGQKDAQQLLLVRRMVRDLCLPVCVRGCPIVRDGDGLALSSRNAYLSAQERAKSLAIPASLEAIWSAIQQGVTQVSRLREIGLAVLYDGGFHAGDIEYLTVVDECLREVLELTGSYERGGSRGAETARQRGTTQASSELEEGERGVRIVLLAVRVGRVRLLDNLWLESIKR